MTPTDQHKSSMGESTVMTVREASVFLRLSETIVRRGIKQRHIPFLRVGKRYLLSRPALESWIAGKIVQPVPEPSQETVRAQADAIWNTKKRAG